MNQIKRSSADILDAWDEFGLTSYCMNCHEFQDGDSKVCPSCRSDQDVFRDMDYQFEIAVREEKAQLGQFITRIAFSLGVTESFGGGFAEEAILNAIEELKRGAA